MSNLKIKAFGLVWNIGEAICLISFFVWYFTGLVLLGGFVMGLIYGGPGGAFVCMGLGVVWLFVNKALIDNGVIEL